MRPNVGPPGQLNDPKAVEGKAFDRALIRRVWGLASAYKRMLSVFLLVIVLGAVVALVPPLLVKRIIDDAIPNQDGGLVTTSALLMVGIALASMLLGLVERWSSSRVGEGLIFDLRVKLFDHVQRMPIAFFTRTQTGALTSRMNNDVIGAQRAVTGTLGSVVSNVIALATTLGAMAILEWRLTLVGVLLAPLFLLPTRRAGRRLAGLTRDGMDLHASMNTTMTEPRRPMAA